MHIAFTGTQRGVTPAQGVKVFELLYTLRPTDFHHGDCIGADADAHDLAATLSNRPKIHVHPCTLHDKRANKQGDVEYAPLPPLVRNHVMVDAATHVIATPKGYNEELRSGTWATIRYARKMKRQLFVIYPDGTISC